MTPYADTNFFTRLYLELPESAEAERLLRLGMKSEAMRLPLTWLHRVELFNAFQLHVFHGRNRGQTFVSPQQAALAYGSFERDVEDAQFLRSAAVQAVELEKRFEELSLRFTARHGFRTYDLLHVASALVLKCDVFWTFDVKAGKLAKLMGFNVR